MFQCSKNFNRRYLWLDHLPYGLFPRAYSVFYFKIRPILWKKTAVTTWIAWNRLLVATDFPLGRIVGAAVAGCSEISGSFQQSGSTPRRGPSQVGDVITPPLHWSTSGTLFRGWLLPTGLALPTYPGASSLGWTTVVGISLFGGNMDRHSRLCEFHSCSICHGVSRRELFTKSHICRLFLR